MSKIENVSIKIQTGVYGQFRNLKNRYMKNNKKQLHEALAVLLTKLSSAMDNPLLMDNYVVKALRTVLLEYKESGELYDAYKGHTLRGCMD